MGDLLGSPRVAPLPFFLFLLFLFFPAREQRRAADEAFVAEMRAKTPSLLQEKLRALRGEENSTVPNEAVHPAAHGGAAGH